MAFPLDVTDTYYAIADAVLPGMGTQWLVGNGASPEVFEAVAGVVSFAAGSSPAAKIPVTHLRSPGRTEESIAGQITMAAFTGTMRWLPLHQSQSYAGTGSGSGAFAGGGLAKLKETGEIRTHKIKFVTTGGSPGLEMTFRGYVEDFSPAQEIVIDGVVGATVSVMPTAEFMSTLPE